MRLVRKGDKIQRNETCPCGCVIAGEIYIVDKIEGNDVYIGAEFNPYYIHEFKLIETDVLN